MRRIGLLVTLALAFVAGLSLPQTAYAQSCSEVCTSSSDCDMACRLQTGPEHPDDTWLTCGQYGICDYPCEPNWVTISSVFKKGVVQYYFSPIKCEYYPIYLVTQQDTRCGQPNRSFCLTDFPITRNDHQCCTFYFCGGTCP